MDRRDAGQRLAKLLGKYQGRQDCVVIALPRGGVPVGFEVAQALGLPLDICVVRKLGVPFQPELAMGAVAMGGVTVLHQDVISDLDITEHEVQQEAASELEELRRREQVYRGNRPIPALEGKTVLLVDDGIATGATAEAAMEALRRLGVKHLVVAVGVAPPDAIARLSRSREILSQGRQRPTRHATMRPKPKGDFERSRSFFVAHPHRHTILRVTPPPILSPSRVAEKSLLRRTLPRNPVRLRLDRAAHLH